MYFYYIFKYLSCIFRTLNTLNNENRIVDKYTFSTLKFFWKIKFYSIYYCFNNRKPGRSGSSLINREFLYSFNIIALDHEADEELKILKKPLRNEILHRDTSDFLIKLEYFFRHFLKFNHFFCTFIKVKGFCGHFYRQFF